MVSEKVPPSHRVLTIFRFSQQMEQYFANIGETMEGYGEFEAEGLAFKVCIFQQARRTQHVLTNDPLQHERLNLERRLAATPQDECSSTTGGSVNTSDIARLMEMFQVCPLISHLDLHIDPSVPRVPFSSIGTSSPLTMRTHGPTRPTSSNMRHNTRKTTFDRSPSGGESVPRDDPKSPKKGRRGSIHHHRNIPRTLVPPSTDPVTRGRRNVPRKRFQSFSSTRLTNCE